jgi:L-amino acid N-acyltransferase YncA
MGQRIDATTPAVSFRSARAGDEARIAAIYNEGIEDRLATFETRPRTAEDAAGWIAEGLPFLVAVAGDVIVGFARVSPYSDRCVYEGIGEHGVYVAREARGRGVGTRLLQALAARAEADGYHKLTSRIFSDNAASLAAHRASAFEEVGLQRRHGRLDGVWKDCVLVERLLGPAAEE